jgi:putative zinc finger/helix-turn-helix YgiT family protein
MSKKPTIMAKQKNAHLQAGDTCPSCGAILKQAHSALALPINGEEIRVPYTSHLKCQKCKEIVMDYRQTKRFEEDAIGLYRKKHSLLSGEEIRQIRLNLGMTQQELAKLLSLGANTISRWESGRNVQTKVLDILLRIIRDLPESVAYLQKNVA